MKCVGAALGMALALGFALMNIGCVGGGDEQGDASLVKRNRELEQLVQEKDAEISRLTRDRDAYKKAYEDAAALAQKHGGTPPPPTPTTGTVPQTVVMGIEALGREYAGVFEFDRQAGRLRFASDVTFDSGSGDLKDEARKALTKLAGILTDAAARNVKVTIVGHTDSDPIKRPETIALLNQAGKYPDNKGLSELRAEAVANVLTAGGVPAESITTQGVGAKDPIAGNSTAAGKAKNRRVEIFLK